MQTLHRRKPLRPVSKYQKGCLVKLLEVQDDVAGPAAKEERLHDLSYLHCHSREGGWSCGARRWAESFLRFCPWWFDGRKSANEIGQPEPSTSKRDGQTFIRTHLAPAARLMPKVTNAEPVAAGCSGCLRWYTSTTARNVVSQNPRFWREQIDLRDPLASKPLAQVESKHAAPIHGDRGSTHGSPPSARLYRGLLARCGRLHPCPPNSLVSLDALSLS